MKILSLRHKIQMAKKIFTADITGFDIASLVYLKYK
ncbi:hypothetical protein EZJ58_4250 [Sodalis ligni]|jgi:hypothetical protein|uniref:Uncharacterized protein n=1 Tax=Sodalis ligni TaxID=2697027 RepID=A0A4R1NMR7_9GAMM|nr:hypothetical protein EZJ58_4250 [Sodalis ligni]